MSTRSPKYVLVLLFPVIVVLAGCGDSDPAGPAVPSLVQSTLITAEPATATPEFLPLSFCPDRPPFGLRVSVTVGGGLEIVVRRLRVDLRDRFGGIAVPQVIPIPATLGSIPNAMPMPLPESTPIPSSPSIPMPGSPAIPTSGSSPVSVPGFSPFEDVRIPAGRSRTVPLFLEFPCGVVPAGTLVVSVETTDAHGRAGTSAIRVPVGH
jgi:hypothetical protein